MIIYFNPYIVDNLAKCSAPRINDDEQHGLMIWTNDERFEYKKYLGTRRKNKSRVSHRYTIEAQYIFRPDPGCAFASHHCLSNDQ